MSDQDFGSIPPGPPNEPATPGSEPAWETTPQYPPPATPLATPPGYTQQPPPGYPPPGYPPPPPPGYVPPTGYGPPPGYVPPGGYPPSAAGLSDNAAGAIAYITIIPAIIFLLMEPYKSRPFVRFHSAQCLVLFGFDVAAHIVLHFIPVLGWMIGVIVALVVFVFWLIALIQAAQGKMYRIPVLGDLAANLANS
jgi:uncharacterized membrane protein